MSLSGRRVRTETEGDDPVGHLSGKTAVTVEEVLAEHVLSGALAPWGDGWKRSSRS